MKIAVFGAGGVGGYLGGLLSQINHDVYFIARGEHLKAIQKSGLQIKSIHGDFHIQHAQATDNPHQVGQVDYVIAAVKHFQLQEAASLMKPLIGGDTTIVPLQNGVNAHEILISALGSDGVVGGFTSIVSMIEAPGIIRQPSMMREVFVGELNRSRSDRCQRIVDAWADCGVEAVQPEDIFIPMWTKYLFIAAFGGVSSLAQVPSGGLLGCPESKALLVHAMEEIEVIARTKGINLAPEVVSNAVTKLERFESTTTSSMQRDVASGRLFELEAFSGTIIRLGREISVPTPVHEMLYALLKPQLIQAQS
jgi:2-dehydropantoate 2-reductase